MAGFREFVTGEVLTASNVDDFLAKQAVMKFADAAARDSALGTAVVSPNALREGMVAYLDDEDEVQYFDGTAWDAISQPIAGIGSNVVSVTKSDVFSASLAVGVTATVTGMSASITPSSNTSKVLVILDLSVSSNDSDGGGAGIIVKRAGTAISTGNSAGSRTRVTSGGAYFETGFSISATTVAVLDSPATSSSVTYTVDVLNRGGGIRTLLVNRSNTDTDTAAASRSASRLTLIEVAA